MVLIAFLTHTIKNFSQLQISLEFCIKTCVKKINTVYMKIKKTIEI